MWCQLYEGRQWTCGRRLRKRLGRYFYYCEAAIGECSNEKERPPRARAGPPEALPQSDKVLRKGKRFLPALPAGDRKNSFAPEYPLRGVRGGQRISGL